jgi:hypothetical protein
LRFLILNPEFTAALSTIQELVEEPDIPQKYEPVLSNDPIQIRNYSMNMDENPMPIFGGKTLKTKAKKSRKFTERKNKRKNK